MSFALCSLYVIESLRYIIKSSFEIRALLSCYDLEGIKKKKEQKEIKGSYIDLMESNDFTYKE